MTRAAGTADRLPIRAQAGASVARRSRPVGRLTEIAALQAPTTENRAGPSELRDTLGRVTFREAAEAVLRDATEPLSANEITERAIASGLIKTSGKRPRQP